MSKTFLSFHYQRDSHRVQQVANMGAIHGDPPMSPNDWEQIRRQGDKAVEQWIDAQMSKASCVIVLVGRETSTRPFVNYEIERAYNTGKGLFGVRVNRLKTLTGEQDTPGNNPFNKFTLNASGTPLSSVVPLYEPDTWASSDGVYRWIAANLPSWISTAEWQAKTR